MNTWGYSHWEILVPGHQLQEWQNMVELQEHYHSVCLNAGSQSTSTARIARGIDIIDLTMNQECDGMALLLQL